MGVSRRYLGAVILLAVLAVAFGVFGTVAPPLAEESGFEPQQKSSSESVGHFQNPPTYDSGWVDIRSKAGQYVTLAHNLNTTDVVVDITGKQSLQVEFGGMAWQKTYGGTDEDVARSVIQTSDGGYAVAGWTYSFGRVSGDAYLVKTDAAGRVQWSTMYGGSALDEANAVVQTSDGGYALAGSTGVINDYDFLLIKVDGFGNVQWTQTYAPEGPSPSYMAYSLVQTVDGGYALVGYGFERHSLTDTSFNFWLVKTDSSGSMEWNRIFGLASRDENAYSLVQTTDSGYAIAGYTHGPDINDVWVVKTDSLGIMQWNKTYGGSDVDYANSLVKTSDNGYALAGYTDSYDPSGDFWLVKVDAMGNAQWNETYGGAGIEEAYSVVLTKDGGYALAGYTDSYGAGYEDLWLVKTDSYGNAQWNKTFGGADSDSYLGNSLVHTSDGGYAIAAETYSFGAGSRDSWLIKVNADLGLEHQHSLGETDIASGWAKTFGYKDDEYAYSLVQTVGGGYALAGYIYDTQSGDEGFQLVKTDRFGNLEWNKTYGNDYSERAYALVQTTDRGFALAGKNATTSPTAISLVKTDWFGSLQWSKTYQGSEYYVLTSMVQTLDGGYALAGSNTSDFVFEYDFLLLKTDSSGNLEWSKTFGLPGVAERANSLIQTGDGGYALAGSTDAGSELWLVKTDPFGNMQWNVTYGTPNIETIYSVIQTGDDGYALAGYTYSYATATDFWLVKMNASGNVQWYKTYGGPTSEECRSLVQASGGGYALAGFTYSDDTDGYNVLVVKTDSAGNLQWSQTYTGANSVYGYSLIQTGDGGYVVAGNADSFTNGNDFLLFRLDTQTGLAIEGLSNSTIVLYRGITDPYWNYVRVRIWTIKEPSWIYGDINMDGIVDAKDLYILGRNYGKTFSLLSLTGIIAIAGIQTIKTRKQNKRTNNKRPPPTKPH